MIVVREKTVQGPSFSQGMYSSIFYGREVT